MAHPRKRTGLRRIRPLLPAAVLALACLVPGGHAAGGAKGQPKDAILLSSVRALTLRGGGAMTAHRRAPAVPQLRCVSPRALCRLHDVDAMRCANQGGAYGAEDVQWSCTADLPPELRLGATEVVCEGYAGPDDDRVLRGSCGVEYTLALTDVGERRYPELAGGGSGGGFWGGDKKKKVKEGPHPEINWSAILFWSLFLFILGNMIYSAFRNQNNNNNNDPRRRAARRRPDGGWGGGWGPGWGPGGGGGGFGGGRGDDNHDPPPPYSKYGTGGSSSQQGWRPGFWSGAATGAAAGYFAGSRAGRQQQRGYGGESSSSGWSSGGGPSSSSSSSGSRHESTGFGGTSRR